MIGALLYLKDVRCFRSEIGNFYILFKSEHMRLIDRSLEREYDVMYAPSSSMHAQCVRYKSE